MFQLYKYADSQYTQLGYLYAAQTEVSNSSSTNIALNSCFTKVQIDAHMFVEILI